MVMPGGKRVAELGSGWALSLGLHIALLGFALLWIAAQPDPRSLGRVEDGSGTMLLVDLRPQVPPVPLPVNARPPDPPRAVPPLSGAVPAHPVAAAPAQSEGAPSREADPAVTGAGAVQGAPVVHTAAGPPTEPRDVEAALTDKGEGARLSDLRSDYAARVWQRIARHRPRGLSLTGTTRVRLALDSAGNVRSAEIAETSGDAALDAIALRTVRSAAPYPRPPADLAAHLDAAGLVFIIPFRAS